MFVAGFIGSPAMNFLTARGPVAAGADRIRVNGAEVTVPRLREGLAHEDAVLGVRRLRPTGQPAAGAAAES